MEDEHFVLLADGTPIDVTESEARRIHKLTAQFCDESCDCSPHRYDEGWDDGYEAGQEAARENGGDFHEL